MIQIRDIRSLTDFHRNSKRHLRRLKRTGRPEVLTMNGRAVLVVQDAAAYEHLLQSCQQSRHSKGSARANTRRGEDQTDANSGDSE